MRTFLEVLEARLAMSAAFDVTGLTALRGQSGFSAVDGSGVGIAVLDSGVFARNPDLAPNVVAFYNAVESAVPASISSASVAAATDVEGHGTHVSGIAASSNPDIGVAPRAQLVNVKVIPDTGESQLGGDPLLRGLQFVAQFADQFNIKVVNMSLGESTRSGGINLDSVPAADDIAREIQVLEGLGITVVSAAGNSYANSPTPGESYPAVVSTIGVASTWSDTGRPTDFNTVAWGSPNDNFAAFERSAAPDRFSATSQRSTLANQVAAPGVDIFSDWNNSSSSSGNDLLHNTLSGTSMAAPFVSGLVALMQDAAFTFGGRYITDPQQVLSIIKATSDVVVDSDVPDNGRVPLVNGQPNTGQILNLPETGLTYTRVNVLKAVQAVQQTFSGAAPSNTDLDNRTSTATNLPSLTGVRTFTQRGTIGTDGLNNVGPNDVDVYRLTLDSPGSLTLALSLPSGGTAFTGSIRLFDAAGNPIARADSAGGSYPTLATDPQSPLATGTYYVGVSSLNNVAYNVVDGSGVGGGLSTGDYVLTTSLSNPDPNGVAQGAVNVDLSNPNAILPGTSDVVANQYQGTIGSDPPAVGTTTRIQVPNGDVDMFRVVASDTGTLTVDTETGSFGVQGVDSYVAVYDANLNLLAANDDKSSTNTDSFVQVPVTIGQTYYVAVTNFTNRTFDPRNPFGRVAGSTPTDRLYNLYLSFNNGDANGTALLASGAGVETTVNDAVGSDAGTPLAGANGGFKDVDFYTYTAASTGLLDLSATSGTNGFTPTLQLWALSSDRTSISRMAETSGPTARLIEPVAAGQVVYVSVTGLGNNNFNWDALGSGTGGQTGSYSLASTMQPVGALATLSDDSISGGAPGTLSAGTPAFGNLGRDGPLVVGAADVDLYRFVPAASGNFDFRTDTSPEGSADTVLRLFDATGQQVAANDNANSTTTASFIRAGLVAGQTYYVGVSGAGTGATAYNPIDGSGAQPGSRGDYTLAVVAATQSAITVTGPGTVREPAAGTTADAVFTVTLDMPASAPVTVNFATADGTAVAGRDYTATSGTLTFAPGETSKPVAVQVLHDEAVKSNTTFSLVLSSPSANAFLVGDAAQATIVDLVERTVNFGGRTAAQYTDAAGRRVTVRLAGPGSGRLVFIGDNASPDQLILDGTTARSTLTVTPAGGTTGVGSVQVNGSLGNLSAGRADLGGALVVTGDLSRATFGSLLTGSTWSVAGSAARIAVGRVAAGWVGTFGGAVANVTVAGNFAGSLTAAAVNVMRIGGSMSGAMLQTTRTGHAAPSIGSLTVAGDVSASQVRSAGDVRSVTARTLGDSNVFAGVNPAVSGLPATAGDFTSDAIITSVRIPGRRGQPFAVANSNVAAASLGGVVFGPLRTDNGGVPFGLAADSLRSYTRVVNGRTLRWARGMPTSLLTPDGDAVVRLFG